MINEEFIKFLDKLAVNSGETALMESIKEGYRVCAESIYDNYTLSTTVDGKPETRNLPISRLGAAEVASSLKKYNGGKLPNRNTPVNFTTPGGHNITATLCNKMNQTGDAPYITTPETGLVRHEIEEIPSDTAVQVELDALDLDIHNLSMEDHMPEFALRATDDDGDAAIIGFARGYSAQFGYDESSPTEEQLVELARKIKPLGFTTYKESLSETPEFKFVYTPSHTRCAVVDSSWQRVI